uniref:RNA-directed DNA polymerase, eukaryota n=1 Tax=Tanacetum cinerariifolium TaxID=118510 RepID=A0A6L2NXK6_TANCI|nr:RNA-directed DNA polymerase, eukaryota [Tanacetum cinerariifolium]
MGNSKKSFVSVLKRESQSHVTPEITKPALVLDETCIKEFDFGMSLMGSAKDVSAIPNPPCIISKEGFQNVKLGCGFSLSLILSLQKRKFSIILGISIKAWTPNPFRKIASLWGEYVEWEDADLKSLSCKQLCLKTNMKVIINEKKKVIIQGKVYWIRVKELDAWFPNFQDDLFSDGESQEGDVVNKDDNNESDVDRVSKSSFMHENGTAHKDVNSCKKGEAKRRWIKELCQKHIINFASIQETKAETISLHTIKDLWGNHMFDHVVGSSIGCSGGILYMWNPNMFVKEQVSTCDYFVALMGTWAPTSSKILIISVYAPQELIERRDLWDYLRTFINRWEGDTVIVGDFNEVRSEHERFGSTFNRQGDIAFNNFISSACLIDLPLEEINYDYGPSLFWFFHSWFAMEGFNYFVETTWKSLNIVEPNGLIRLKKKLQAPKIAIKAWSKEANKRSNERKINIQQNLSEVDKLIDQGKSNDEILIKRIMLLNDLQELNNRNAMEISQKPKFDGPLKQFSPIQAPSICFDFTFLTRLSLDQVQDLERTVTYEEVKRAVWDCGTNKSPGPEGFSFKFYRKYWITIDDDVFQAVKDFFVNGHFPRGRNSSFIALVPKIQDAKFVKDFRPISLIGSVYKIIAKFFANRLCVVLPYLISDVQSAFVANRQILDGPFILNELLSWCKFKKLNGMIFKINSCLNNAMGLMLVNGSPTLEFQFHKGLKQDDVVFIGEWNNNNIQTLLSVFRCFYLASGLKINLHKSKLMGIGVSSNVVATAASLIGCSILTAPFNYLGVKVGSNMSRITSWDDVISKFSSRLSKWKLKLLSIGGRLSLLKSVLTSISLYHMSIFKVPIGVLNHLEFIRRNFFYGVDGSDRKLAWIGWNMVLTSKNNDGLGVSSFLLIIALSFSKMCKSISVAEKMGHPSLSHSFRRMPRGGVEQRNYGLLCSKVVDLVLPNISDRWCWSLESSQVFSVKSFCILIDNTILPKAEFPTRWLRVVPIKANVHA